MRRTARNDEIMMFRSVIASEAKQSYTIVIASEAKQSGIAGPPSNPGLPSVIAIEAKQSYTIVIASEAKQSGIDRQILTCLRLLRSAALWAAPLAMTRLCCLGPSLRAKRSNLE